MKKYAALMVGLVCLSLSATAQNEVENYYDNITDKWLEISDYLSVYEGLGEFCQNPEFREYTLSTLHSIHHSDSLVLDFLLQPGSADLIGHHEFKLAMKELDKIESEYSSRAFIGFLRESCMSYRDLERNKEELKYEVGQESYDGQILILENYLRKYLHHVDKRVKSIDKHIHRIHPDIVLSQNFELND